MAVYASVILCDVIMSAVDLLPSPVSTKFADSFANIAAIEIAAMSGLWEG